MKLKTIAIIIAIVTIAILAVEVLAYIVSDSDRAEWSTEGGTAIIDTFLYGEVEYNSDYNKYLLKYSDGDSGRSAWGTCEPVSYFYGHAKVVFPDGSTWERDTYGPGNYIYFTCTKWHKSVDFKTWSWFYDDYAHQYFELWTWTHLNP